jgi:hypothetical protein
MTCHLLACLNVATSLHGYATSLHGLSVAVLQTCMTCHLLACLSVASLHGLSVATCLHGLSVAVLALHDLPLACMP